MTSEFHYHMFCYAIIRIDSKEKNTYRFIWKILDGEKQRVEKKETHCIKKKGELFKRVDWAE